MKTAPHGYTQSTKTHDSESGSRLSTISSQSATASDVACVATRRRYVTSVASPVYIYLPLVMLLVAIDGHRQLTPKPAKAAANTSAICSTMDPNAAPWWELALLPKVGETLAKRIVDCRREHGADGQVVFRCADDLRQVRGIGPKTIQRIRPYLRFSSGSSTPTVPE